MTSSRRIIGCSAMAVLLVTLGAAVEVYDDSVSDNLTDLAYYEEANDLDKGSVDDGSRLEDMMLYKLLKNLPTYKRPNHSKQYRSGDPEKTDLYVNASILKRLQDMSNKYWFPPTTTRPPKKREIKMGRKWKSLTCYFKICNFRKYD